MKNKKTPNKFDILVERLIDEFLKIPNFDLTSKDEPPKGFLTSSPFELLKFTHTKI
jgi:hypothetical protein